MTESEQFKIKFQRECERDFFRDRIKAVVSDQIFANNLIQRFSFTDRIREEIKDNISYETNKIVTPMIENKLNHFALHHLPALVSNQLSVTFLLKQQCANVRNSEETQ